MTRSTFVKAAHIVAALAITVGIMALNVNPVSAAGQRIKNYGTGKCMAYQGLAVNNAKIVQNTCNTAAYEQFVIWQISPNLYTIRVAANTTKCVTISGNSQLNGAHAILYTCSSPATQNQTFFAANVSPYELEAQHSSKCLQVDGASTADGAQVSQWQCTGANHFKWFNF
jgi:hypothetical protein